MAAGLRTPLILDPKINTNKLNSELGKVDRAAKKMSRGAANLGGINQSLGKLTGNATEFRKSMDAATARVFAFGATAAVLNTVTQSFKVLVRTTIEVEKSLIEIQSIFGSTEAEFSRFRTSIFKVAKDTGQAFKTVAEGAAELARQGLGVEETAIRLNAALVLTRVSGLGAEASVNALTAAINGYAKAALTAEEITNKIIAVDISFAVSAKDLADGFARAGSTAEDAGVSFDEFLGIITAVRQTTSRSGAVIGNAFKSIFPRLTRSKTIDQLKELGVQINASQGGVQKLKALAAAMERTADPVTKNKILELAAGLRQINILSAALKDLSSSDSIISSATEKSLNATNEAFEKNEQLNKSLSAQINRLVIGATDLGEKLGQLTLTPVISQLAEFATGITDSLASALDPETGNKAIRFLFDTIGKFIQGPGLTIFVAGFTKIFQLVTKFAKEGFAEIQKIGQKTETVATAESKINNFLSQNLKLKKQLNSDAISRVDKEKMLIKALNREVILLKEQEDIVRSIASRSIGLGGRGKNGNGKSRAAGFSPSEGAAEVLEARSLGARGSIRPHMSKGRIGGKKFVMNSQEIEIPNFGKNGDSLVIPRYARGNPRERGPDGRFLPDLGGQRKTRNSRVGRILTHKEQGIKDRVDQNRAEKRVLNRRREEARSRFRPALKIDTRVKPLDFSKKLTSRLDDLRNQQRANEAIRLFDEKQSESKSKTPSTDSSSEKSSSKKREGNGIGKFLALPLLFQGIESVGQGFNASAKEAVSLAVSLEKLEKKLQEKGLEKGEITALNRERKQIKSNLEAANQKSESFSSNLSKASTAVLTISLFSDEVKRIGKGAAKFGKFLFSSDLDKKLATFGKGLVSGGQLFTAFGTTITLAGAGVAALVVATTAASFAIGSWATELLANATVLKEGNDPKKRIEQIVKSRQENQSVSKLIVELNQESLSQIAEIGAIISKSLNFTTSVNQLKSRSGGQKLFDSSAFGGLNSQISLSKRVSQINELGGKGNSASLFKKSQSADQSQTRLDFAGVIEDFSGQVNQRLSTTNKTANDEESRLRKGIIDAISSSSFQKTLETQTSLTKDGKGTADAFKFNLNNAKSIDDFLKVFDGRTSEIGGSTAVAKGEFSNREITLKALQPMLERLGEIRDEGGNKEFTDKSRKETADLINTLKENTEILGTEAGSLDNLTKAQEALTRLGTKGFDTETLTKGFETAVSKFSEIRRDGIIFETTQKNKALQAQKDLNDKFIKDLESTFDSSIKTIGNKKVSAGAAKLAGFGITGKEQSKGLGSIINKIGFSEALFDPNSSKRKSFAKGIKSGGIATREDGFLQTELKKQKELRESSSQKGDVAGTKKAIEKVKALEDIINNIKASSNLTKQEKTVLGEIDTSSSEAAIAAVSGGGRGQASADAIALTEEANRATKSAVSDKDLVRAEELRQSASKKITEARQQNITFGRGGFTEEEANNLGVSSKEISNQVQSIVETFGVDRLGSIATQISKGKDVKGQLNKEGAAVDLDKLDNKTKKILGKAGVDEKKVKTVQKSLKEISVKIGDVFEESTVSFLKNYSESMETFVDGVSKFNEGHIEMLAEINAAFSEKLDAIVSKENSPSVALQKLNDAITKKAKEISDIAISGSQPIAEGTTGAVVD